MKRIYNLLAILSVFAVVITSCENDEPAAPVISDIEIGASNSHTAYIGGDLHLEATILAEAKIGNIRVLIHQEDENEKSATGIAHTDEWEFDSTYTGVYANVKNPTFHEHVDVPSNAVAGTYHLHLYVTDLEGNQTMVEEELEVAAPVADGSLPVINVTSAPATNASFTSGSTISIAGTITDTQGLAGVYIGLVKESQLLENSSVGSSNTITILHNHDFEDPTNYSFSASIKVGATTDNDITPKTIEWSPGNYYILVKSPGVDGEVGFSARYPVVISLN